MKFKTAVRQLVPLAGLTFLLQLNAWSQAGGNSQDHGRTYINLPKKLVNAPFSDGVLVGNTYYMSGRIGIDTATGMAYPDLEKEITALLDGFKSTLAAAGMTMDNLVYVQVFCPDLSLYDKFNSIYRTYFRKDFPARAFLGSGPLLRGGHFEMQGIAVK